MNFYLDELRQWAREPERARPEFSGWSVGEHIHHLCLAMTLVSEGLKASSPPAPRPRPSARRLLVLKLGFIPRGRARAPRVATPSDDLTAEQLLELLDSAQQGIDDVSALAPDRWFRHFLLDVLTRDQALRFLSVHNNHHRKIILGILRR